MGEKKRNPKKIMSIRIDADDKESIEGAARALGMTTSGFVASAAIDAAERVDQTTPMPPHEDGDDVPGFFRAACAVAARGGHQGYARAGFELASKVRWLIPDPVTDEDWDLALFDLRSLLAEKDIWGVIGWFRRYFAGCLQLVPQRRRTQFAYGAIAAFERGQVFSA
ncbi:DUF1778 domain-containing protein [Phycisphaerales bacterium AB-hyl4]|uniref:DUF1778 domain-containing protein n=1 Tax=Natronomicrosphaera hydrolytica TaxID=3242702 RepID=A0ABV4UB31_9BACT